MARGFSGSYGDLLLTNKPVPPLRGYHILLHHKPCTNAEIHLPVLVALAGDAHRAADKVKIGHVKLCDLALNRAEAFENSTIAFSR